jgi:hypothetical protein
MPLVQKYGDTRVDLAPLPGARLTSAETPLSEGAGVAQAKGQQADVLAGLGGAAARVGEQQFAQMQQAERDRADQVAMLEARNTIATWKTRALFDPQTGALAIKGKDAMALPETVNDAYNKVADGVEQGLTTPRQRAAFQSIRAAEGQSLDLTVRRHVFEQMQTYEGNELQALLDNTRQSAIASAQDPGEVGRRLDVGVQAIRSSAPRLGFGPEETTKQIDAWRSSVHVGVIENLLDNEKTKAAEVYFGELKDQIAGSAQGKIEAALQTATDRGEAQKQSDLIIAAGGTLTEQREKAKAISDPKLRDDVTQRIDQNAAFIDRSNREAEAARMQAAYDIVDQTHDVTKIPPSQWAGLAGSARNELRDYAAKLAKGVKPETDAPTYYSLMRSAASEPQTFAAENLLKYRNKLDATDFKQLVEMQGAIVTGDRKKADEQLAGFRTNQQVINSTLAQYGIDPTPKDGTPEAAKIGELYSLVGAQVDQLEALTGKKPTNKDVQQVLNGILSSTTAVPGPGTWWKLWLDSPTVPKRLIDFTYQDIPAGDQQKIIDKLHQAGLPVSEQTVLDVYLQTKIRLGGK